MADNTTPRLTLDSEPETAAAVQEAPTLTLDGTDAPAAEPEKSAVEPGCMSVVNFAPMRQLNFLFQLG